MTLRILQIKDDCTGCGACVNICPKSCLVLAPNNEGFYYPQHNLAQCINCHLCESVCHIVSPLEDKTISLTDFYMYQSSDIAVRKSSSSGGAYSLFAAYTLQQQGVVFGCKYNGKQERLEFSNSKIDDWHLFRKSKYIEAYTGDAYKTIDMMLREGKQVFFCGTPCQIRGLKHYLHAKHTSVDNLLTADFICHGVPSNGCFTSYKRQFEKNRRVEAVDFRYKDFNQSNLAWHNMVLALHYDDKTTKIIPYRPPYYYGFYKVFMDNIILRRSCYSCHYPSMSSADITFADFWGIHKYKPKFDDNTGISVVKLHSKKAKDIWRSLNTNAESLPYEAIKYIYEKPSKNHLIPQRNYFFDLVHKYGYIKATRKIYKKELRNYWLIGWLKPYIKRVINCIK